MTAIVPHILHQLVYDFKSGILGTFSEQNSRNFDRQNVEITLATCILSSSWVYEKAILAARNIYELLRLGCDTLLPPQEEFEAVLRSKPLQHRFPRSKARQLHASLSSLRNIDRPFENFLSDFDDEFSTREYFAENFSGLGYKQSSMFLRDLGFSQRLAIVDIHILWYLENAEGFRINHLSKFNYLKAERVINNIADDLDISVNDLDRIMWVLVREFRKTRRRGGCETQYALPLEG